MTIDRRRVTTRRADPGSVSVEAVLLAPVLVVLLLMVVHVGRLGSAQTRLTYAADHAARAASMVHPRVMPAVARSSALDNLLANGLSCESVGVAVDVLRESDPMIVQVDLECELDRTNLGLLMPRSRLLKASSSEVVDRWRIDS